MNDLIAGYITRDKPPSYYAFVKDGMTTSGEYWEKNPRSHCHDMMGSIIKWYYTCAAGIHIEEAGCKAISIYPYMPNDMNLFDCTYESVHGTIHVYGKRKNGKPVFTFDVSDAIKIIK